MILSLFRRPASDAIVERLYLEIVAAARRPAFFLPPISVPDSPEGRFEVLVLHAVPAMRRLSELPAPAPDLAQDVTDRIFEGFDAALREMGVGDLKVPKRMKSLAEDFGGRSTAYVRALATPGALEPTIARNVFGRSDAPGAVPLGAWLRSAVASFAPMGFDRFEAGSLPFPALETPAGETPA